MAGKADLLDINSATKDQLAKLPGIGDVYRRRSSTAVLIKLRRTSWYRRRSLPRRPTNKIKDLIIAKQKSGSQRFSRFVITSEARDLFFCCPSQTVRVRAFARSTRADPSRQTKALVMTI